MAANAPATTASLNARRRRRASTMPNTTAEAPWSASTSDPRRDGSPPLRSSYTPCSRWRAPRVRVRAREVWCSEHREDRSLRPARSSAVHPRRSGSRSSGACPSSGRRVGCRLVVRSLTCAGRGREPCVDRTVTPRPDQPRVHAIHRPGGRCAKRLVILVMAWRLRRGSARSCTARWWHRIALWRPVLVPRTRPACDPSASTSRATPPRPSWPAHSSQSSPPGGGHRRSTRGSPS